MVKIEPSPGGGGGDVPPLSKSTDIPATSSANDLDNSGPKVSGEPVEKKTEQPRFADPQNYVGLTKHSDVPVGGNMHGYRP